MQLRSGPTYWSQIDAPAPRYAPLTRDVTCHVAIIGGGITGALAADLLTQAGLHVVLIDRRQICQGSTAASTGLLQYEIDTSLTDLAADIGRTRACRAYRATDSALRQFEDLVAPLGDPCGLVRKQSLYLASRPEEAGPFREEHAARRECGIDVEYLSADELRERFGLVRPAALLSPVAFEVDPYRLAAALIARAAAGGAVIHGETEAREYDLQSDGVTLRTAAGCEVRARHVVFATGYETPEFIRLNVHLKSTYAMVTQPLESPHPVLGRNLIWESARPYLYVRSAPEGRLMIGGEDIDRADPAARDALIPEKMAALADKFHRLFPSQQIVPAMGWAGTFAETPNGLPLIGPVREFPRGYFALGYGGNGITFSLLAAQIIRDALLGRANPHADLFRLER